MKAPYSIPMSMLCASCGYALKQHEKILLEPAPHIPMKCVTTNCVQKEYTFNVLLKQADIF
jgi:hypothetical protein